MRPVDRGTTSPVAAGHGSPPARRPRNGLVGYAPGAYDLFHVGHLNLLRRVRLQCDFVIAGVVSDEVALVQKGRLPVVPEDERLAIVAGLDLVDEAVLETTTDKLRTWQRVGFDVVFKGSDWQGSPKWVALEAEFTRRGVRVVYLPYTRHVCTSVLRGRRDEVG
jgi:glycerol-3-phosphate cytidylyltransferase